MGWGEIGGGYQRVGWGEIGGGTKGWGGVKQAGVPKGGVVDFVCVFRFPKVEGLGWVYKL